MGVLVALAIIEAIMLGFCLGLAYGDDQHKAELERLGALPASPAEGEPGR